MGQGREHMYVFCIAKTAILYYFGNTVIIAVVISATHASSTTIGYTSTSRLGYRKKDLIGADCVNLENKKINKINSYEKNLSCILQYL